LPNVPAYSDFKRILPGPDPQRLWMIGEGSFSHPDVFDTRSESWSPEVGLPDGCEPMAVRAQDIWCGGYDGLWIVHGDGQTEHFTAAEGLPSNIISAIKLLPDGSAWVASADRGLAFYDGKKISQVYSAEKDGLTSNEIRVLLPASDGTLWVGTLHGVDRLLVRGTWVHYPAGDPFSHQLEHVNAIVEDRSGGIWVAGWGEEGIVYRFMNGVWKRFAADVPGVKLPKQTIVSMTLAPDGSLWFGSYFGGAARYDGISWTLYEVRDGLVSGHVKDIYVDPQGTVWFATGVGVTRMRGR
jgi:ligand-binding sensor domain-containing protein